MAAIYTSPGRLNHDDGSKRQRLQRAGDNAGGVQSQECGQETAAEKLERSRQLNLAAQARYRRKLADSVRDLEAAVEARQREVIKAGERRFHAYTRNRELHTRDAEALATLISLAGEAVTKTKCSLHPAQPAAPPPPAWSVKSALRQTIAAFYTAPPDASPKAAANCARPACSAASCHMPAAGPVPAPLSGPQLLAAFPQQPALPGLPYACVPSKMAAAAAMHARTPNSQDPSARSAAATIARFSGELRQLGEAVASSAGVRPSAVQWFLQSPWKVATGSPVSLSAQMSAPSSVSSFYLCTFMLHLEELFVAAALYPNEPLPTVPGTPSSAQQDAACAADADTTAATINRELQCMLAVAYGASGPERAEATTELCCGVGAAHPVARGVPHVVVTACRWYRQRLPRRQWLLALSAFVAAVGSKRTFACGVPSHETCRHREQLGGGCEGHAVPRCLRCSVYVSALQALQECLVEDTEGAAAVHAMSTEQIRACVTETASFAALLHAQFLLDEPWLSRSLLHSCGVAKHHGVTEQQMMVTLYARLKLTPQQRQVTAALWKCWSSRRRAHDRVHAAALRHLMALLPDTSQRSGCLEDYVSHGHLSHGRKQAAVLEPCGTSRPMIMRTQAALKALRSLHRQDGDMLAEVTRAWSRPRVATDARGAARHSLPCVTIRCTAG